MTRLSLLTAAFVLVVGSATAAPPSDMRWARGIVTDITPATVTLKLRSDSLTISLDPATTVFESTSGEARPVVGNVVEAHYLDKKKIRTAVLVFHDGAGGSTELSKKPGHSYRGITQGAKRSTLKLTVGKRTTGVELDKHTRLVDAEGRIVATGRKDIEPLLIANESVIVKYGESDTSFMSGDTLISGSATIALEVRKLKKAI